MRNPIKVEFEHLGAHNGMAEPDHLGSYTAFRVIEHGDPGDAPQVMTFMAPSHQLSRGGFVGVSNRLRRIDACCYAETNEHGNECSIEDYDLANEAADLIGELLAALKTADAHFTGTFSENGTDHQQIRAAIAKAEGSNA